MKNIKHHLPLLRIAVRVALFKLCWAPTPPTPAVSHSNSALFCELLYELCTRFSASQLHSISLSHNPYSIFSHTSFKLLLFFPSLCRLLAVSNQTRIQLLSNCLRRGIFDLTPLKPLPRDRGSPTCLFSKQHQTVKTTPKTKCNLNTTPKRKFPVKTTPKTKCNLNTTPKRKFPLDHEEATLVYWSKTTLLVHNT